MCEAVDIPSLKGHIDMLIGRSDVRFEGKPCGMKSINIKHHNVIWRRLVGSGRTNHEVSILGNVLVQDLARGSDALLKECDVVLEVVHFFNKGIHCLESKVSATGCTRFSQFRTTDEDLEIVPVLYVDR